MAIMFGWLLKCITSTERQRECLKNNYIHLCYPVGPIKVRICVLVVKLNNTQG
jgi:hypothetical protein